MENGKKTKNEKTKKTTIVTTLYSRELSHPITKTLYPLTHTFQFPLPLSSWQPPPYSLSLWVWWSFHIQSRSKTICLMFHVAECPQGPSILPRIKNFHLFMAEYKYIRYIHTYICFIHFPVDGHLSGFQVLALVNNAVMTKGMQVSLWIPDFLFPSDIDPEVGLLDHTVVPCFIFWRIFQTLFHSCCTYLHSPTEHQGSLCPTSLPALVFSVMVILTGVEWCLIVISICISLLMNGIEHLCNVHFGRLYVFGKMSIQSIQQTFFLATLSAFDPSHSSDNTRSLTPWASRELSQ